MMEAIPLAARLAGAALMYVAAYAVGIALFAWSARRRGFAREVVIALAVAGLVGGLIGANLVQLAFTGQSGKTILGGIAGGYLAIVLVKRRLGITRRTGDLFAVALAGGEALGRLGCFIGGCCFGKVAQVPWAVYDHEAWRHPTQLYLAFAAAATLAVLLLLERRAALPDGALFVLQGLMLCASRFGIEYYRDVAPLAFGLTSAQLACLAGFAFFAMLGLRLRAAVLPQSGEASRRPSFA